MIYICILIIFVSIISIISIISFDFEFFKNYIDKQVPYYKEIQEIDIPNKTFEKDCSQYKFDEINKIFYTQPKFLLPKDACISQCMQGVWFGDDGDDHTSDKRGHLPCCEKACNKI